MTEEIKKEEVTPEPTPPVDPPAPDPIWKQQGYASSEEAMADALGLKAAAEIKAAGLAEELAKVPKPMPPAPILKPEDADDPAAVAAYQQKIAEWQVDVITAAQAPSQPSPYENQAAIERALVAGEFLGQDRHILRGTMESMSYAPEYAALATTPDGIAQLGKLAMQKLKPEAPPTPTPPEPDPPEKQYSGDPGAASSGKTIESDDDETKRKVAVKKAAEEGRRVDVVKLALEKGRSLQKK